MRHSHLSWSLVFYCQMTSFCHLEFPSTSLASFFSGQMQKVTWGQIDKYKIEGVNVKYYKNSIEKARKPASTYGSISSEK